MAEPPHQSTGSYHPEPRYDAPTFSIGTQLFMFRGSLKSYQHKSEVELPRNVEVFDSVGLSWKTINSVGELPPWIQGAAVTTYQDKAYFFGGYCGTPGFCNDLFTLNSTNVSWKKAITTGQDTQVLRTMWSGLVSLPSGDLLTTGGRAEHPTEKPTAGFIPEPESSEGRGRTSQFLYYRIIPGMGMGDIHIITVSHDVVQEGSYACDVTSPLVTLLQPLLICTCSHRKFGVTLF